MSGAIDVSNSVVEPYSYTGKLLESGMQCYTCKTIKSFSNKEKKLFKTFCNQTGYSLTMVMFDSLYDCCLSPDYRRIYVTNSDKGGL